MKGLLRNFLFHLLALWLTQQWVSGLTIRGGLDTYLLAAFILSLLNLLLKPVLKLLFFPVNAISLGLFSLVINAGVFYLFLHLVPEVTITEWVFPGIKLGTIVIPSQPLSFWMTLFIVSFSVSVVTNFFTYLVK